MLKTFSAIRSLGKTIVDGLFAREAGAGSAPSEFAAAPYEPVAALSPRPRTQDPISPELVQAFSPDRALDRAAKVPRSAKASSTAEADPSTHTLPAYLKAPRPRPGAEFGRSIALSESLLVVGAPYDLASPGEGREASGAAYVYARTAHGWALQGKLSLPEGRKGDRFGFSAAVSGDTIVIGAPEESRQASGKEGETCECCGAAYVFARVGAGWALQARLSPPPSLAGDGFGYAVAVCGDRIAIGTPREGRSGRESGAAYLFTRVSGRWAETAYVKAPNADSGDSFGSSVALSGDGLIVGAPGEAGGSRRVDGGQKDNSEPFSGAAYVFERSGGAWAHAAYLKASNAESYDWFGCSVAISGNRIVVGACGEASAARGQGGEQEGVGCPFSGAAYAFLRTEKSWKQAAYLKASNTANGDGFGSCVAVGGESIAVGAPTEDRGGGGGNDRGLRDSGAAYLY